MIWIWLLFLPFAETFLLSDGCSNDVQCPSTLCSCGERPSCVNAQCICRPRIIILTSTCNDDTECARVTCSSGDDPICLNSQCICKRRTGYCTRDDECNIGECDEGHPHCHVATNTCGCMRPHDRWSCFSDSQCTGLHCGHEHNLKHVCLGGICQCMSAIPVTECGSHHHHPDHSPEESCPHSMCTYPYTPICAGAKCACTSKPPACNADHDCSRSQCPSHQTPLCYQLNCYCVVKTALTTLPPTTTTTTSSTTTPQTTTTQTTSTTTKTTPMLTTTKATTRTAPSTTTTTTLPLKTSTTAVHGQTSDWQAWGQCTATCGGFRMRVRSCQSDVNPCSGDTTQVEACGVLHCPVDGSLTTWGSWTPCSSTCGHGSQARTRTCIPPLYGGKDCVGNLFELHDCNRGSCPNA